MSDISGLKCSNHMLLCQTSSVLANTLGMCTVIFHALGLTYWL